MMPLGHWRQLALTFEAGRTTAAHKIARIRTAVVAAVRIEADLRTVAVVQHTAVGLQVAVDRQTAEIGRQIAVVVVHTFAG